MAVSYKGFWTITRKTLQTASERALWVAAAGVAFFAFYTLIPTLAVLVVTYGMLGGGDDVHARMQELGTVFPDEAMQALFGQLMDTAKGTGNQFGWGLFGILAVLVWSALFGMRALMAALNHAYHEVETRGFFKLNGLALLLGFGLSVLTVALIGVLTAGPFLLQGPAYDPIWSKLFSVGRWPVVGTIVVAALSVCYRLAPCHSVPRWRWVGWGAIVAATLWMVTSAGFSFYVRRIADYATAFGLAGAVLTLMIWLYLLAYAVLLGAVLNAETEREAAPEIALDHKTQELPGE
jgi:membrane protein